MDYSDRTNENDLLDGDISEILQDYQNNYDSKFPVIEEGSRKQFFDNLYIFSRHIHHIRLVYHNRLIHHF